MPPHASHRSPRPVSARRNVGFTLVELVVVIVVIGVVGTFAVPRFVNFGDASKKAATQEGLIYLREQIQFLHLKSATSGGSPGYPTIRNLRTYTSGKRPANPYSPDSANETRLLRMSSGTLTANIGAGGWAYDPETGKLWANSYSGAGEHNW